MEVKACASFGEELFATVSPGILARKCGQPHTNCNKSKLNGYGFLDMSWMTYKSPLKTYWGKVLKIANV